MRGQTSGGGTKFFIFAIFYMLFVLWGAALWPTGADSISGSLEIPVLPLQPNIIDFIIVSFQYAWFYVVAFFSFNISFPIIGLITTTITLVGSYMVIVMIRG